MDIVYTYCVTIMTFLVFATVFQRADTGISNSQWIKSTAGTFVQLSQQKETWENARTICRAEGGDLVKILDKEMNNFIAGQLPQTRSSNNNYWIGLNDRQREGMFAWLDESLPALYLNWQQFPSNMGNQDCVEIGYLKVDKWNDIECSKKRKYICERHETSAYKVEEIPTPPSSAWIESPSGTLIKLSEDFANWEDARTACQGEDGDLVKILNKEMNSFVANQLPKAWDKNNKYWIGLHDHKQEGIFVWLDESNVAIYLNWNEFPTNLGDQDCVEIGFPKNDKWNDYDCFVELKYICEKLPAVVKNTPEAKAPPSTSALPTTSILTEKATTAATTKLPATHKTRETLTPPVTPGLSSSSETTSTISASPVTTKISATSTLTPTPSTNVSVIPTLSPSSTKHAHPATTKVSKNNTPATTKLTQKATPSEFSTTKTSETLPLNLARTTTQTSETAVLTLSVNYTITPDSASNRSFAGATPQVSQRGTLDTSTSELQRTTNEEADLWPIVTEPVTSTPPVTFKVTEPKSDRTSNHPDLFDSQNDDIDSDPERHYFSSPARDLNLGAMIGIFLAVVLVGVPVVAIVTVKLGCRAWASLTGPEDGDETSVSNVHYREFSRRDSLSSVTSI